MEVTLLLVIAIFAINVYLHRPVLESFLFSLALAVGLTPQLLPAIISVNLAHGARRMAQSEGHRQAPGLDRELRQHGHPLLGQDRHADRGQSRPVARGRSDVAGEPERARSCLYAYLNASFQTGYANPIDEAIRADGPATSAANGSSTKCRTTSSASD